MMEPWLAQQTALSLERPLSRPELERISLLIDIERSRPSFRRSLAGKLVRLGLRLEPSVAVRLTPASSEPSSR